MSTASHPKTYKAYAFLEKGGDLHPIDVKWKDPQVGEIVIKVLACGVCASDETVRQQWHPTVIFPRVPGHEIVGDVVSVAPGEKLWKVGDRVGAGWHGGHCHACHSCRAGDFVQCVNASPHVNGVARNGGYAEYVTVRSECIASIPADLDPAEAAPLLCAGVTTFNSLRNMNATPPDFVAIQGIGGLGHLAIQFARAMGFRTVALSSNSSKEALARQLGAHEFIDGSKVDQAEALQKLGGAKLIIINAPSNDAIPALIPGLATDGELLILALTPGTASVPLLPLVVKRLSIRGWPIGSSKDCEDTALFAKAHGIKSMVQRFPLHEAQKAFDSRSSARFRNVLVPWE
ncbi:hypothetical protein AcV5_003487 [Taiwanofungus camphoratus]|nr:hypothetical protein AcV5_003487 [Antrodia cinnamomea]KAI0934984.1 hypothetical protein AcV7_003906 [Antrodia cinnamomea]